MTNLERFQRLFQGRENVYGQFSLAPDGEKRVMTVSRPVTQAQWEGHLEGAGPFLGIVPIRQDNHCLFGAIDVDEDGVDLAALEVQVVAAGLPLVVCRSKSGGAHLYLFLQDPAPARTVVQKLKSWSKALGRTENPDGRPIEIFPKQDRLKPTEVGNWINLPYYGGEATNRYAVKDGSRITLEEFLDLAEETMVTALELEMIEAEFPQAEGGDQGTGETFGDGPPCLQALHQLGYPSGTRNQGLFQVGVYLKQRYPDDWRNQLEEYNRSGRFDPPLGASEVVSLINSLEKRDYNYQCEQLPIAPHCQRTLCRKRKFGIAGMGTKQQMDAFPKLGGLTKVLTDPPTWVLEVNGQPVSLETDDLMAMIRFRKKCLEQLTIIVPQLKQAQWDDIIRDLIVEHTVQEAPEDAGVLGQFRALVREFMLRRHQSVSRDDILMGKPWEDVDKGRVWFRSVDLDAHLKRKNFREYTPAKVYMVLREMGAGHGQFNLKGAVTKVWWLPSPKGEQDQEFDAPESINPEF